MTLNVQPELDLSTGQVAPKRKVAVIMTVKNDAPGCAMTMKSLLRQTREPDEIIVVDGGSSDSTIELIQEYARWNPSLQLIEAPGVNIAQGRNIAVRAATSDIIASIDSGCRAQPNWLSALVAPFEQDSPADFVAGFYRLESQSLLEQVVGLATMNGQLDPVDPVAFNPSARSLACTKSVWKRAGGWPEWLCFSEDTLFDKKVRRLGVRWEFAGDAIVDWRPRSSLRAIAKQFFNYGTGRGHTRIGAADFLYNVRNIALLIVLASLCFLTEWAVLGLAWAFAYFYVWTFHPKAVRIARRTGKLEAYPLCLLVLWVVLFSHLTGFLVGVWQRYRDRERFEQSIEAYMANA